MTFDILTGDALTLLPSIQPVHSVMTSPPYFKLRHYGDNPAEIGWESLEDYIDNLVGVFNAVRLVKEGSLWVNISDTRGKNGLMQVPELFSISMRHAGWNLIDSVIWAKVQVDDNGTTEGHCMIEPAPRRLNGNGYEHLYRFVRCSPKEAWTDSCAVAIPREGVADVRYLPPELMSANTSTEGRALTNVWRISLESFRQRHYAPYPVALCERPIAMTCPMRVCSVCGHLRSRIVEKQVYEEAGKDPGKRTFGKYTAADDPDFAQKAGRQDAARHYIPKKPVTVGWTECEHASWMPGRVLDPFCGSGTTGVIALRMGRSFVGIDLYPENVEMSRARCQETFDGLQVNPADLEH